MNEGVTGIPRLVIVTLYGWNKTSEGRWSSMIVSWTDFILFIDYNGSKE